MHKTKGEVRDQWRLSDSGANDAVLQAQNDRWGLGPIETINSGHNVAVVNAQIHKRGLGPIGTCNSGAKALFCMQKPQMRAGTHRD